MVPDGGGRAWHPRLRQHRQGPPPPPARPSLTAPPSPRGARRIGRLRGALQQELVDRLETDKSHVLRLIDQLEVRELLSPSPAPTDRRRHRIELTPAGRKLLRQVATAVGHAEDDYLSALSDPERRSLISLLQQELDLHDQA